MAYTGTLDRNFVAAAAGSGDAAPRPGFWGRAFAGMAAARLRQAEHAVADYAALSGLELPASASPRLRSLVQSRLRSAA